MTPYELMDLRGTISESYMSTMKLWLTVTFACFGAGNFASSNISILTFILLFIFYGSVSIGVGMYLTQLRKELHAVEKDITSINKHGKNILNVIEDNIVSSRNMIINMQWVNLIVAPITFGAYLYSQYKFN